MLKEISLSLMKIKGLWSLFQSKENFIYNTQTKLSNAWNSASNSKAKL